MRHLLQISLLVLLLPTAGCKTADQLDAAIRSVTTALTGQAEETQAASPKSNQPSLTQSQTNLTSSSETRVLSGALSAEDVIDGDTINLGGKRIRLHGIDAPELAQMCTVRAKTTPCGVASRNTLIGFVAGATVTCTRQDIDRYGRDVSKCEVAGFDLSAGLVKAGQAVAYRQYSSAYVPDEDEARRLKRGIWTVSYTHLTLPTKA